MGFIADAMRTIENRKAEKRNRQRSEDYLRQLEIEELERRARFQTPQESSGIRASEDK